MPRMQDIMGSEKEAAEALSEFVAIFASYRCGHCPLHRARSLAVDLLNDCAPTMIEEFLSLCNACALSDAWSGVDSPREMEDALNLQNEQLLAASERLSSLPGAEAGLPPDLQMQMQEEAGPRSMRGGSPVRPSLTATPRRNRDPEAGTLHAGARRHSHVGGGDAASTAAGKPKHKVKDYLKSVKKLVPYGRGQYAMWFTICNLSLIVALFAYMCGDYAMWARAHKLTFQNNFERGDGEAYLKVRV